ncbi:hypothetical protein [Antarcticirhabdus aurantiaca]|uniref:Uncharacterized protein n=1 Tax=Antarcticirhabdus aurantiaca TaxID=2606717 RepID=A0ACD4NVR8_9HYPH|nr:hypothetical protein OXU80_12380 [Jeongeuplla avenae]
MPKARFSFGTRNGTRSGYADYRYGSTKPVTLAAPGLTRPRPILKGAVREAAIAQTVETMSTWRKTPFEHEGAVRAGLRIAFVEKGTAWARSDAEAAQIVEDALRRVGAIRPSFEESQPGHALGNDFCHWCFCPIDEEDRTRGRRFCSAHCAKQGVEHMTRETTHHYGTVLRSAIRILAAEKAPPQTCKHCERSFKTDRRKQDFCSIRCANLHHVGDRALIDRSCGLCGSVFKPHSQGQRYCSQSCGQRANRRAEAEALQGEQRQCTCCGGRFQPRTPHARFCSTRCNKLSGQRAYKDRNRPPTPHPAHCSWCGDQYQPKIKLRTGVLNFCSTKCNTDCHRFARGDRPRDLTRRTFDHYLALPIDEMHRRRLTPQKLDWLALELGHTVSGEAMLPRPAGIMETLFGPG